MLIFLDSPIAIEFVREGSEVRLTVVADVGVNLTRTPLAHTRISVDTLPGVARDTAERYNARLADIDPRLPAIYGFRTPIV